ncbi:DUF4276 family protein [Mucilaginibacter psychrotolerans]|uniref:DUF4276 family protein n=1 Tax=Mucilaginibacter psychrotolerans TaxID=1524096 RepID=A0A4Y8SEY4_9SPHI|nr:DUF4276 family protein [Mucilaginibacter psychrotolerans]TFF37472.1 DUF4276 family protein [Mucilaginibacter psychrotolerans]
MKRLVFLVEGDTEVIFINQHVIPYLYKDGFKNAMHAQKIITNRQLNKKGGNISYEYLKNDIGRILAQGNVIITTFLDFFRLPNNFPGYSNNANDISIIENMILEEFGDLIIPYIQKHEMEALMYSGMDGFKIVVDDEKKLSRLQEIINKYENPEEINTSPQGAPSKRLIEIFKYDKVLEAEMILEALGIEVIIQKCPGLSAWLQKLKAALMKDNTEGL